MNFIYSFHFETFIPFVPMSSKKSTKWSSSSSLSKLLTRITRTLSFSSKKSQQTLKIKPTKVNTFKTSISIIIHSFFLLLEYKLRSTKCTNHSSSTSFSTNLSRKCQSSDYLSEYVRRKWYRRRRWRLWSIFTSTKFIIV